MVKQKNFDMILTKDGYICVPIKSLMHHLNISKEHLIKQNQDIRVINALIDFYQNMTKKFLKSLK